MSSAVAEARWRALGMEIVVQVGDPRRLGAARAHVEGELAAADAAYSPHRDDTELRRVAARAPEHVAVSSGLFDALVAAKRAAALTGGLVDPTATTALAPAASGGPLRLRAQRRPAWRQIACDMRTRSVGLPAGARIDLGAAGKALIADRGARGCAAHGSGALVAVGGDIATAGPPPAGGWCVRAVDDHREQDGGELVRIDSGAVATSGVVARGGHVVDPRTGTAADGPWRTVTVAAATCVDANTASTAALILGADAPDWLEARGLPARLVAHDGTTLRLAGWPEMVA